LPSARCQPRRLRKPSFSSRDIARVRLAASA
jgi:hypothetical protein